VLPGRRRQEAGAAPVTYLPQFASSFFSVSRSRVGEATGEVEAEQRVGRRRGVNVKTATSLLSLASTHAVIRDRLTTTPALLLTGVPCRPGAAR
jgi:hypothetical protein